MDKILNFVNHPFIKLIFNKLKEIFSSKEYKDLTEPITEEVVTPTPVVKKDVAKKSVVSKSVAKKPMKKTTNKK
jgi:hypothetical protein